MGRSTSESNMQGLRKKGKQITVQSTSLTMTLEGNMQVDTAKGKWEQILLKIICMGCRLLSIVTKV